MAYVKQIAIGTDVYDIKAKAYDGLVPVANGGTGADNTADAKVNLNLCASGQDFRLANYSTSKQIWGFRANCINTNNTDLNGKNIGFVVENDRLLLYNQTDSESIWNIKPSDYLTTYPNWGQILQSGAENIDEGTSDLTDHTEIFTSYATDNGFSDTHAPGKVYRRSAIKLYNYIQGKTDDRYLKLSGGTMTSSGQVLKAGQSKSWYNGRDAAIIRQTSYTGYCPAVSMKTTNGSWEIGVYSNNNLHFCYVPDASYTGNTNSNTVSSARIGPDGKVYGAVWNDFAEYRVGENNPGKVMVENGDDTISISTERLQAGSMICSDTFGFAIGETGECKCPIAIAGRVLAYTYEPRDEYKNNIGQAVCSGPDGTVSLMTKDEVKEYPECVIGYISAVPDYEEWGTGKVKVNGRVWIKVK